MSEPILATVVITPRERYSPVPRCLANVLSRTTFPHRMLYVAGGAPPYVEKLLKETFKGRESDLILEPEYLAPNHAKNLALRRVETKYVVFLDNDVVVEPGWLEALVKCAEETGADVVGPLCLFGEPELGIIHSMGGDLKFFEENGRHWMIEKHRNSNDCLKTKQVEMVRALCDYVEFHCMLTRKDLFDRIGLLDEEILSSCEHMDLALLARDCGAKTYTEPSAVVSYLTDAEYLVSDAEHFRQRWCDDWNKRSLARFSQKWNHDRNSSYFKDHESFLGRQQEICRLPRKVAPIPADTRSNRHPFAQTFLQLANQIEAAEYSSGDLSALREAYETAMVLNAGLFRGTGKTMIAHVVGTASVLAAFGAPSHVIVAGLLHTAYAVSHVEGERARDLEAQRRWLTGKIGWRSEALVYEYCRMKFEQVHKAVLEADLDLLRMNLAHAIILRIANSIDEHLDFGLLHTQDPAQALARNSEQNLRWKEIYEKVALRLGYAPMLGLLASLHDELKRQRLPSVRPSTNSDNFALDPVAGTRKRLISRTFENAAIPAKVSDPYAGEKSGFKSETLLERLRRASVGELIQQIDLKKIQAQHNAVVRFDAGFLGNLLQKQALIIETDPRQWSFSAQVEVTSMNYDRGPAVLRLRLLVKHGEIGIGVLRKGSSTEYALPEQSHEPSKEPLDLLFPIPELSEIGPLIFRNWAGGGLVTTAKVFEIALYHPGK